MVTLQPSLNSSALFKAVVVDAGDYDLPGEEATSILMLSVVASPASMYLQGKGVFPILINCHEP